MREVRDENDAPPFYDLQSVMDQAVSFLALTRL
jgi:hypothetical protein